MSAAAGAGSSQGRFPDIGITTMSALLGRDLSTTPYVLEMLCPQVALSVLLGATTDQDHIEPQLRRWEAHW